MLVTIVSSLLLALHAACCHQRYVVETPYGGGYVVESRPHHVLVDWSDAQLAAGYRRIGVKAHVEAVAYGPASSGVWVSPRLKHGTYVIDVLMNACAHPPPGIGCLGTLDMRQFRLRVGG
jgi:hypothetical protein